MAAWDLDFATDRVTLSVSDKSLFGDEPGTYDLKDLIRRIHPEDREEHERAIERNGGSEPRSRGRFASLGPTGRSAGS